MKTCLEYIFQPDAQAILDHFCGLFGIRIAFFAADGAEVLVGRAQPMCDYCRLLRDRLGLAARCREQDRRKRAEADAAGGLVHYTCHAGLTEAVMPLRLADRTAGYVMIGQVRCEASLPRRYGDAWHGAEGTDELARAFAEVPSVTPDQLRSVLGLFRMLVDYMTTRGLVGVRGDDVLPAVLAWMEANAEGEMRLADAARAVHRSPSTVSHLFTKRLGKSFRQVRTDLKLDRAAALLSTVPGMTVQEAARRAGFDDPLYFSRLFRRHRGRPPSDLLSSRG